MTNDSTFKGYATTTTLINMDEYVSVAMPTGVVAGDYLVAMMGNVHQTALDPSGAMTPAGWTQLSGQAYIYYKVADGSESGGTVDFRTFPSFPSPWFGEPRVFVGAVLLYSFTEAPSLITTTGATVNFGSATPGAEATSPLYGTFLGADTETRVYGFIGTDGGSDFVNYPITDYDWINASDRSGVVTQSSSGGDSLDDTLSIMTADYLDMSPFGQNQRAKLHLVPHQSSDSDEFGGIGGDLFGIRFVFSTPTPVSECLRYVYGFGITTGTGFEYEPNKSETGGYVKAGGLISEFPVGPTSAEFYLPGALIIATVKRYTWTSSTPPPTGTLSGFGATWDLISYEEAVGNGGAAFTEIYRTMQPTYGSFPADGFLTYTFPPNADTCFSSVGWKSYLGADPSGLTDNGASAIANLTTYPATVDVGNAAFTHPATYRDSQSILWSAFYEIFDSTSGGSSTSDLVRDVPVLDLNPSGDEGYGSAVLNFTAQEGTGEVIDNYPSNIYTPRYHWTYGYPRTWWAASLEIMLNPNAQWCFAPVAYWGILATPA